MLEIVDVDNINQAGVFPRTQNIEALPLRMLNLDLTGTDPACAPGKSGLPVPRADRCRA